MDKPISYGSGYGHLSWLVFEEPVIINTLEDFIRLKAQLDELSDRYGRQLARSMERSNLSPVETIFK